jgi:hypothetical protein
MRLKPQPLGFATLDQSPISNRHLDQDELKSLVQVVFALRVGQEPTKTIAYRPLQGIFRSQAILG